MSRLGTIAVILAAAATAVLLNVVLLNSGSSADDPVGRLTPTAALPASTALTPAPPGVVQPSTGEIEGEDRDD
jgi:hypothetical protein